MITKTYFKIMI